MEAMMLDRAYPDLFSPDEAAYMAARMAAPDSNPARSRLVRAGEPLQSSAYLSKGFLGRFSCDRQGRRQFVALQVPGDYVDLPAYLLKVLDHDIDSLGPSETRTTPHSSLNQVEIEHPQLYKKLWKLTMIDASIHRYWIFRIGRLSGRVRLANLFCEMFLRLFARGLATPQGYALPVSQGDLAEICGMTPVHINRLLAELRLEGICNFAGGRLQIHDLPGMFREGQHSRSYLYLPERVEMQVRAMIGDS